MRACLLPSILAMPGHDSKGSVEQSWAALGVELDAKEKGEKNSLPDDCWATPEDGWAALAAEMASCEPTTTAPLPVKEKPVAKEEKIPSFSEFTAGASNSETQAAQNQVVAEPAAIPSFDDFKASMTKWVSGGVEVTADVRARDPSAIERGWEALGAELDRAPASEVAATSYSTVEDGWAALGAELDARR